MTRNQRKITLPKFLEDRNLLKTLGENIRVLIQTIFFNGAGCVY